jgi:hypothetical protein
LWFFAEINTIEYIYQRTNMAGNNITTDWQNVINSAARALLENERKLGYFEEITLFGLYKQRDAAARRLAAAKTALATATANGEDTTAAQAALVAAQNEVNRVASGIIAADLQVAEFEAKSDSLRASIAEAETQIARQAAGTTPATNTRIAATVTPASAQPGNPNVATTPTPAPVPARPPAPVPTPAPSPSPPAAARPTNTNITNPTNTTSTASTTVITTPESVTVITEESTTTTSSGSRTVTVPPTTSAPNTTAATATTTPPRTSPQTTTNPSNAALPLGNDIDDIYDPNLTPEQIASLSPGDRRARENFFIEEAGGDPNTDGLGEVEEDGTIVVTAPREDDEIVVNGRVDWRARLSLAPDSTYFYNNPAAGILAPLISTNGVIFPYTPAININYVANYEPASIVHNNYKVFQYSNSFIDSVTITCDFTAQDDGEANYMLAVIHFFRSLTKMFFGQDQQPKAGTPPPLCYLRGMGAYQFANHPLAVSSFAYNLPNDVDYISTAGPITTQAPTATNNLSSSLRLPPNVVPGGVAAPPMFESKPIADRLTWVPTKMQMVITCIPMMSRNEVSNVFSLEEYSNGILVSEGFW